MVFDIFVLSVILYATGVCPPRRSCATAIYHMAKSAVGLTLKLPSFHVHCSVHLSTECLHLAKIPKLSSMCIKVPFKANMEHGSEENPYRPIAS